MASCFHNVWLRGTYVYTDQTGKWRTFRREFCTCWDLLPCSLRFTPPFTSSGTSPTRGAFLNLGDPGALKALQPTPLVLCPRTEMPQEFVLISGLCNVVPRASLGMCVSGNLHKFLHFSSFLPTYQDLESDPTVMIFLLLLT